jgi:hypothetical protein
MAALTLLLFCGNPLGADPFTIVSPGDPLLEDLRQVVREQGESFLSLTPPLSGREIQTILEGIDPSALSSSARLRYHRIFDRLVPALLYESPIFSAALHINLALEGRFRSNTAVPWQKKDNTSQALLALPAHLFFSNALVIFIEPLAAADPWYYNHPPSSWGSNIPWEAARFDLNMPLRAFAAAGGSWWSFQIGRDRLSFGPGRTGNMAVSDNPDYYDFARLSFFSGVVKYSMLVSQMPLEAGPLIADPAALGGNLLMETTRRYFYLHRLDFRFFRKLSVGVSEGLMAGNASLELRYLNPAAVFHSFFSWRDYPQWGEGDMNGSLFSLDLEWAFLPGWVLYSQIVMNEFSTPYETKRFPDQPPPGMGYLLGAEYAGTLFERSVSCYAELVYADPFLYTLSSPFASMIWMRRSSDLGNKDLRYAYFGHGEGRDMFLAALGVSAVSEKLALSLDMSFKRQGERGILWDWSTLGGGEKSPSGTPETRFKALFSAEYKILPSLTLAGCLGGTVIFDAAHVKGNREYGIETGLKAAYYY